MSKNKNLANAKKAKNDEFYTLYEDIKMECDNYAALFSGKVIYCNFDDPHWSNFFQYFLDNFTNFGLKKLIATSISVPALWPGLPLFEVPGKPAYKAEVTDPAKVEITELPGTGDFRSPECVQLLQEADIVVTNPAFSLFREFIALLMKYKKKFLVLGNQNAFTYKEIFPLIKNNQLWTGVNHRIKEFIQPDGTRKKFGNIEWFTNLPNSKQNVELFTGKKYYGYEVLYPKYDNYDAINVNKITEIPDDYFGVVGVPITFLDSYNPKQFEIVKFRKGDDNEDLRIGKDCPYFRILIKRIKKAPADTEQQEKG